MNKKIPQLNKRDLTGQSALILRPRRISSQGGWASGPSLGLASPLSVIIAAVFAVVIIGFGGSARAADVHVYPTDDGPTQRSKVEGAVAGDNVLFHPGTYNAAVFKITNSGNATDYITFKAYNPNDKPLFDMSRWEQLNRDVDANYPACTWGIGEWHGGDWGAGDGMPSNAGGESWTRGAFVIWRAGYINIEDLEFINVRNYPGNAAGIMVNAEGGPVNIRKCKVTNSDFGFGQRNTYNAGTDLVTVSNCEFGWNGEYPNRPPPGGHNIYTSGGTVIFEYCYIHDSVCGQNLHMRNINAIIRYCWIEHPYSYMADMADIRENTIEPDEQVLTFMGNIFVNGKLAEAPYTNLNTFVMMEGSQSNVAQTLNFFYNTFIGRDTYASDQDNLFSFSGWGGHEAYLPEFRAYNNILYNVYAPRFLRNQYTGTYRTRDIQNNWLNGLESDYSSFSSWMSNNIFGTDPGFTDLASGDYTLTSSAQVINQANSALGEFPGYEYLHNMEYRIRESVNDLGAYEYISTGPDTTPPHRSNPQPTGTLSSGTTSTTISLDTDETAICKYSANAGTNYDLMENTFTNTNSTSHSTDVTDLSDGNSYTYYIRCQDESNNQNTDDFEISFNITSPSTTYSISNFITLVTDWLKSESGLESDVNGDGIVNTRDLGIMMSNWSE